MKTFKVIRNLLTELFNSKYILCLLKKGQMLKKVGLMCAFLSISFQSIANVNDAIHAFEEEAKKEKISVSSTKIKTLKSLSSKNQEDYKYLIDNFINNASKSFKIKENKPSNGAILLLSFSMPDSLLLSLANQASQFEIPVVMNGLVEGDFKKTIDTFARLNKIAEKQKLKFQGLSIDPLSFEQFKISSVPALVVSKRQASCKPQQMCLNQTFDVVYGNASVKKSLELIAFKGELGHVAKKILEQGHA